jgi:integrase
MQDEDGVGIAFLVPLTWFKTECAIGALQRRGVVSQVRKDNQQPLFDPTPRKLVIHRMQSRLAPECIFDALENAGFHYWIMLEGRQMFAEIRRFFRLVAWEGGAASPPHLATASRTTFSTIHSRSRGQVVCGAGADRRGSPAMIAGSAVHSRPAPRNLSINRRRSLGTSRERVEGIEPSFRFTKREEVSHQSKMTMMDAIDNGGCSDFVLTMPSLTKDSRGRSPFWICCYTAADGQRCKKSTKQTDRTKAWEICLSIERAERFAKAGTLTEQGVRKILSEILERTTGEPLHNSTASDWLNEWIAGKAGVSSARTLIKYRQIVDEFTAHLGNRANLNLAAISTRDIRSFRDSLAAAGHSPSTVNGTMKVLAAPFNGARRLGHIAVNPCAGVEMLRDDADTEKDVFTPEQVGLLLETASDDWAGAILAAYTTGLRLRDVADLSWGAFDFDAGIVRVKTGKTGTVVVLPIHPDFMTWLAKQTRGVGKAAVFPTLAGKSGAGKSGLSMAFKRIMEKAGIVGRTLRAPAENSAGRTQSSLSFHSLRHSFNSAMANAGVSQEVRQKLTGHTSAKMNTKYTHHELEPLRAAIITIPSAKGIKRSA